MYSAKPISTVASTGVQADRRHDFSYMICSVSGSANIGPMRVSQVGTFLKICRKSRRLQCAGLTLGKFFEILIAQTSMTHKALDRRLYDDEALSAFELDRVTLLTAGLDRTSTRCNEISSTITWYRVVVLCSTVFYLL